MITITPLEGNILQVKISGLLSEADFPALAAQVDPIFRKTGSVRLLADATEFAGWADMDAAAKHFRFVRDHEKKVERIALIAGHAWQHWLAGMASAFVHPEIKVFNAPEAAEAQSWLLQKQAA